MRAKGLPDFEAKQIFAKVQPHAATVQGPLVHALSTWAQNKSDLARIDGYRKVKSAFWHATQPDSEGSISVQRCQHPELTLACHFIREQLAGRSERRIEIGVSKASCYWCRMWLEIANTQLERLIIHVLTWETSNFLTRDKGNKRDDGWILPREEIVAKMFSERLSKHIQGFYNASLRAEPKEELNHAISRYDYSGYSELFGTIPNEEPQMTMSKDSEDDFVKQSS